MKSEIDLLPSKEELDKQYKPSDRLNRRIKAIIIRNRIKQNIHAYSKFARRVTVDDNIIIIHCNLWELFNADPH